MRVFFLIHGDLMSNLIATNNTAVELPAPRVAITIRTATLDDIPFIDRLQKMHSKAVGFMHRKALDGYIDHGRVIVAEDVNKVAVGYCLGTDRYFKHDDVGMIYQLNVVPQMQRSFVGAALLKAQFERSAYGCKLYSCWCAKDLGANQFWEAMGFVPLAFRAGSTAKDRVHIFWQKRIRQGDATTPYWFPSKTDGGALRADRVVLPIPPGTHWSECEAPKFESLQIEDQSEKKVRQVVKKEKKTLTPALSHGYMGEGAKPVVQKSTLGATLRFGALPTPVKEKPKKAEKVKMDPRMKEAARELKDRWLEHVNAGHEPMAIAKYDVSRLINATPTAVEVQRTAKKLGEFVDAA